MCFDEKMGGSTKNNMSEEEKKRMVEHMMECCCSDMKDEDKQEKMKDMHKMMHHIKECGGPMMGMMMGKMHGKSGKGREPGDLCKEVISTLHQSHKIAILATPEVQGLFEDWVEQIEQEILDYLNKKDSIDIKDLANQFKISKDSAYYFLTKLAQKGKINLSMQKDKS